MVNRLAFGKWQVGVTAIHRAAGGIHQVFSAVVPATLKDRTQAHQVALQVGAWILNGIANPGLGGEVNHQAWLLAPKQLGDRSNFAQVKLLKAPGSGGSKGLEPGQSGPLQGGVVVAVEVVDPHHPLAPPQQPLADRGADEARRPGYEHSPNQEANISRK